MFKLFKTCSTAKPLATDIAWPVPKKILKDTKISSGPKINIKNMLLAIRM